MTTVTPNRQRPANLWHLASLLYCLINLSLSATFSKPVTLTLHHLTVCFLNPPAAGHCGAGWLERRRQVGKYRGGGRSHHGLPLLYARAQSACSICPETCSDTATERLSPEGQGRGGEGENGVGHLDTCRSLWQFVFQIMTLELC